MAAMLPNTAFVSPNQPVNQIVVQPGAEVGTSKARVLIVQKTLKYCTYYMRDYYNDNKCHDKYPTFNKLRPLLLNLLQNDAKTENLSKIS